MLWISLLLAPTILSLWQHDNHGLHLHIYRRGGRFLDHGTANLTRLSYFLEETEARYSRTYREVLANRLVRKWDADTNDMAMLDEAGLQGRWYAMLEVGSPSQTLEVDLDFLSPDFYTILTTNGRGSRLDTFASQSHGIVACNEFVHSLCRLASDKFNFSNRVSAVLQWPICQPSKCSRHTLSNSGSIFGLSPGSAKGSPRSSLSRLTTPSILQRLRHKELIGSSIWSVTMLDTASGVLSLGGALAVEFEETKIRTEAELRYFGQIDQEQKVEDEVQAKMAFAIPTGSRFEDHFKWIDVSGASGWWTGLMGGVWVDGIKVLKNQPFLIDPNCPFVIAPPTAFTHLYDSVSGSRVLNLGTRQSPAYRGLSDEYQDSFRLYPCLNPPDVAFELAGWPFPLTSRSHLTRDDAIHGPAGGPFSLGKVEEVVDTVTVTPTRTNSTENRIEKVNSGFCVGIVVGSNMGERETAEKWLKSGMRDTWVLGEPFIRGMGIMFDDGGDIDEGHDGDRKARMGFRSY